MRENIESSYIRRRLKSSFHNSNKLCFVMVFDRNLMQNLDKLIIKIILFLKSIFFLINTERID